MGASTGTSDSAVRLKNLPLESSLRPSRTVRSTKIALLLLTAFRPEFEGLTLVVISTYIVLAQLTMAEAMPMQYFVATSATVTIGLILNCLFYFGKLSTTVWRLWEDVITIGGLSVLPQIMW